jgi:hypothetical protein
MGQLCGPDGASLQHHQARRDDKREDHPEHDRIHDAFFQKSMRFP